MQATKDGKIYNACFDLIFVTVVLNVMELADEIMKESGLDPKTSTLQQFQELSQHLRNRISILCKWDHKPPKKTQAEKLVERTKAGGKKKNPPAHKWAWGSDKADDEVLMLQLGWFYF